MWDFTKYRKVLGLMHSFLSSQASARSGIVGNKFEEWTLGRILKDIKTLLVTHRVRSITAWEKTSICSPVI